MTDENCPNCNLALFKHSNKELVTCAINEMSKKELLGQQDTEHPSITSRSKEVTVE